VLTEFGNQSSMCTKRAGIKAYEKDRLKDKYESFILVLIMHVIYDSNL